MQQILAVIVVLATVASAQEVLFHSENLGSIISDDVAELMATPMRSSSDVRFFFHFCVWKLLG